MIRNSQSNDNGNNNSNQHEQNFISDDENSIDLEESNNMDDSTSTNNMMVVSSLDENSLHDTMNDDPNNGTHRLVEHSTLINSNSPTTMMTMNSTTTPNNLTKPFRSLPPLDTRNLQPNLEFNRQSSDNLSNRRRMRLLSYQEIRTTEGSSGDIAQQTLSNNDDVVVEEETTTSNNNTEALNDSGITNATPSHHVYQEDIYTNMPANNSSPSSLMISNQDSPTSASTELMEDTNGSSTTPQNVDPIMSTNGLLTTPTRMIQNSFLSSFPRFSPSIFPFPTFPVLPLPLPSLSRLSVPVGLAPIATTQEQNTITSQENNDSNVNSDEHVQLEVPKPEEKELFDLSKHDIVPPSLTENTSDNFEIPNHFMCPITKLVMYSPVRNMYGKVYERESIDQWWKTLGSKQQQPTDPLTNQVVSDKTLVEDAELKNEIQQFLNRYAHLKFSINDLYFPKQIIREMKVAIDSENYAKIVNLISQFPANFFVQTKFPVPPQSAQGKTKNEKETSVSVFDCLYRRFKTVFDSVKDGSPSDVHFMNDPIIGYVVRQYLIVRDYFVERQKQNITKAELTELKLAENSISQGLKNIFVNSVRLFPNISILNWLVSIGASIASTNQFKQNAFHMACMTDQVEIAKHLYHLNNEAMNNNPSACNIVEERLSDEVKRKWNAFYLAIWHNSQKIIDWIIDDAHLSQRFLLRKHKCMVKDKSSIYHPMNALSLAAYKKNIPLMEVLIKKFSFEVPDEKYHPIYWSCIANDLNGFKWICNYIETNIPNGAEVLKSQLKAINERAFKRSLIHAIAMEASDDMMEYYLQKCRELDILEIIINTQDTFGNTALHYACEKSKTKTIAILIKEGIAHEFVNRQGKIASQCCKTDEDREAIQKAIKLERELLRTVVTRVKELEDDVSFLKRKILEMEEFNKKRKFE